MNENREYLCSGEKTPGGPEAAQTETGQSGFQPAETIGGAAGNRQQHIPRDLPGTRRKNRGANRRGENRGD